MSRMTTWMGSHKLAATLAGGAVVLTMLVVGFLAVAQATDRPAFCGSACHEMGPFHAAWTTGPHKDVACVECHVDSGQTARLTHKFEALGEVVSHFSGNTMFPRATPPKVPDERCIRCHATVTPKTAGFDHVAHAKRGPCVSCHADAGHDVTTAALQQAGVFNTSLATTATASAETSKAVVDGGAADLAGHVTVVCSQCHKMAATACSACHTSKHPARGECTTCHKPGVKFVFVHPQGGVDCASCHKPPAKHTTATDCARCHEKVGVTWTHTHVAAAGCGSCHARPAKHRDGECFGCHKRPGVAWAFSHPSGSADCASCHTRPAQHRAGACQSCHRNTGKSWAFAHPSAGASCASCHARPAGHRAGSCSSCHRRAGVSWAFSHPSRGANCANCHNRPSKHQSGSCSSCHRRAGVSWAFSHPGIGANCRGCHARPAGMPAGQCSNCHRRPGVSWAFSHPRIPGGEHSSRSFACTNCHPNGYSTHTCIKCHDSAAGGDD